MTSYLKIEWRYSFAPVEFGGRAKNWRYMQNFSFIAPWLQRAVFQYLLNLLCACVQRSASVFRADNSFSWFGFQSWPNLPNFEAICVENTQLCSKNPFLHINEETLALSHLSCQNLIKTLYVLVVVYISWQGISPKMFTMVNFLMQIMISVWQMLETKSLLWYFIFNWF